MQGMRGLGLQPGNQFGQAGQSMGQASSSWPWAPGPAIGNQSDALERCFRAQSMIQQLAQNGPGRGPATVVATTITS